MNFHLVSIFPEVFEKYFQVGILGRSAEKGKITINTYDLREYSKNKHKKVDDTSYGGGPGMVILIEPVYYCLEDIKNKIKKAEPEISEKDIKVVLMSAKGKKFNQKTAERYRKIKHLILICGRYEGVDERVVENLIDEEISIGEYVLNGGELPAMVVVDAVSRLIPGVLGNDESLQSESHNNEGDFDYPVYSKPEKFKHWTVPEVLLSGNHKKIENWREKKRKKGVKDISNKFLGGFNKRI